MVDGGPKDGCSSTAPGHDGLGASSSARAGPHGPATSRRPEADKSRVGRQGAGLLLTTELVPWRPAPPLFDISAVRQPCSKRTRGDGAPACSLRHSGLFAAL